jgi:hypothetical protein
VKCACKISAVGGECQIFDLTYTPFLPFGVSERVTFSDTPKGIFGITQKKTEGGDPCTSST